MNAARAWRLIRFGITAAALFVVFVIFSAGIDLYSVMAGAAGALIIAAATHGVFIAEHEASLRAFMPSPFQALRFLLYLTAAMYASSARVLAAVMTGKVSPRVVHFRCRLKSDVARVALANSITFTPGTITLDLNDDHLTVHWLLSTTRHSGAAGEAVKGRLEEILRKVWM